MRMFVAVIPSTEAMAHLTEQLAALKSTQESFLDSRIRWIPNERWHITLAFLGEVQPERLPRIHDGLQLAAAAQPVIEGLQLAGLGCFASVLWVGVRPTARFSPADRLARAVQRSLRSGGLPIERRPWRAHLTVARLRDGLQLPALPAIPELTDDQSPLWSIQELVLVHSMTGPDPSYEILQRYCLS